MVQIIDEFSGDYEFLSNFYPAPIIYDVFYCETVEHGFQAMKTLRMAERRAILAARSPGQAKMLGRSCTLRPDWELVKDKVMFDLLRLKFEIPKLRQWLRATAPAKLVEGNTWHDNVWGVCTCAACPGDGENRLGRLLMAVRGAS